MRQLKIPISFAKLLVLILLILYFLLICIVNFLSPPSYYNSDMYSDIILAEKMWTEKTLFPENWIFGNQVYVIATPVLSSLVFGFVRDPFLSMGIASTIMTIGVFVSFLWMLNAAFPSLESRLYSLVYLIGIVLFFGDAAVKFRGWQLLFTRCSYYACYAITAFLAFGCYLRSTQKCDLRYLSIIFVVCLFSFATGIQSLRQTMVMTVPLFAVELLSIIGRILQKKQPITKSSFIACFICISNISGILAKKALNISQTEIFGSIHFLSPTQISASVIESFSNIIDLFMSYSTKGIILSILFLIFNIIVFFFLLVKYCKSKNNTAISLLMLFAASIGCIWGIDIIFSMYVREIYYFMMYPLLAILAACIYSDYGSIIKKLMVLILLCLSILNVPRHIVSLMDDIIHREEDVAYEISEYLENNNYTVALAMWDFGDEIAVASNGNIKMQFWYDDSPFIIHYPLRESVFYGDDINKTVYVFYGDHYLEKGIADATNVNVEISVLKHFEEENIYVCTATDNLMRIYSDPETRPNQITNQLQ